MLNKYNQNRAKIHFIRLSIVEIFSIIFEKLFSKIKDIFRFLKLDKSIIWQTIKEIVLLVLIIIVISKLGELLLYSNCFGNLKFISELLKSLTFIVDNYNQYLLACLGVGGFLVALFLSNLSGIITAKYINIVSKVSISVLTEYANKKYLKSIINYLCLIVIQLCCWIFNIKISPIIALVSVFLTIRIIIIYFSLTQRVFLFSDINTLTKAIYQEINIRFKYLEQAIKKNKTDSIFDSYGNQLISLLDTLKTLQKKIIKENSNDDITKFTNYLIAILVRYSKFKNLIPTNSKWYRLKYEPVNWFEADFFEVKLKTQTGTSLYNRKIIDRYFLEEYINNLYISSIEYLIDQKEGKKLYRVINNYYLSLDMILNNCSDFKYWNKFNDNVENLIIYSDLKEDDNYNAIIDFLSLNRVSIILNCRKYISDTYNNYFEESINNLGEFLIKEPINNTLFTNINIVNFIQKIKYEKKIEGKIITSNNYICEYLAFYFIEEISQILEILKSNYDSICLHAKKLYKKEYCLSSCLIYSRIIEIETKYIMTINEISSIYEKLKEKQYNLKFNKINTKKIIDKINQNHYINLIEYAEVFLKSNKCDYESSKIDFCGQIFYNFSEAIFETLINDDYNNFEKIYKYYPSICLMAESFVYTNLSMKQNSNYLISKYKIPMITFMNLNGYIIYHSHLANDKKWEDKLKDIFTNTLDKLDNSYEVLKRMVLYASIDKNKFDMNDMVLNLKERYSQHLMLNSLIKLKDCKNSFAFHKEIDSNDELIKKFTYVAFDERIDFYHEFYEIFIMYYINPLLNEKDKFKSNMHIKKEGEKNGK